ncbi:Hsp70-Hsp90 organizing protein 2 [Hondaea fermentalgiana]|uniref:Hsp70-Hsp90 organizing protein 2 n=1 Tax=Hondaea fermentalgiana TaxID=2315210 RepID=A0A2R5GU89_9STRA|nr:Hsp70-Hsp90 organizing protein 2 [Hondaea fermentalgiana]|eukprot:GBG34436.1 Hsp70-Hsp90 organizing protein 2 [Hondaea fermentalgiana]
MSEVDEVDATDQGSQSLAEIDVPNDVPKPACLCGRRALRRERYRPHLCPMEIRNKRTIYEGVHVTRPYHLVEDQLFRRVQSKLPPDTKFRDQLISVETNEKTREWCEAQLERYNALLERHEQAMRSNAENFAEPLLKNITQSPVPRSKGRGSLSSNRNSRTEADATQNQDTEGDRISLPTMEDPCANENLALPYTRRAALLMTLGRYEEALESARKAATLNVHLASAFYQWGLASYYLGDFAGAADAMLKGLRHNPRNPRLDRAAARLRVLL